MLEYCGRLTCAIDRLSGNLQKTTSFFRKQTADEADKILPASYEVQCNDELLKSKFYNSSHCPSSATSPSLLGMFPNTLRIFNASYPCLAAPTVANSSPPEWRNILLLSRSSIKLEHWNTYSGQAAPAVSLICLLCNKSIVIYSSSFWGFRLSLRPTSFSGKSHMALALKRFPAPALCEQHGSTPVSFKWWIDVHRLCWMHRCHFQPQLYR